MDFNEFAAVYKAYAVQRDTDYKDRWNRMRMLGTIMLQPHVSKGRKITPEKLLRFPWDDEKPKGKAAKKQQELTPAQQRKRMEELVKKLGDSL